MMDDAEIKQIIDSARHWIKRLNGQIEELQTQCSHPSFTKGLSIIGCIQPILICDNCGFAKPIND